MLRNFIKVAFRNLARHPLYGLINAAGLAVGISSCLLIGLFVWDELSYDGFQKNADRMVRVTMEYKMAGTVNQAVYTGTKVGPQFSRTFPEVESYVRTIKQKTLVSNSNIAFYEDGVLFADRDFFKDFSFKLLRGDAATVLAGPDKIVLTREEATKYFGDTDPIGKTLRLNNAHDYEVTGIAADAPGNSQIRYSMVASFESLGVSHTEEWFSANYITYLLVNKAANIPALQSKIVSYMKGLSREDLPMDDGDYLTYHLEPLRWVHLHSTLDAFEPNGSITNVAILTAIAILILIIACINYANLATARAAGRATEIGVRKVLGSRPRQIFTQFIGESGAVTFVAFFMAMMTSLLLLPLFNNLTGKSFTYMTLLKPGALAIAGVTIVLVSFLSGAYPALLLSRMLPQRILKSGVKLSTGVPFRKPLIVFQFVVSIFLIAVATIILEQVSFIQNKDLGYNRYHVLVLPVGWKMHREYPDLKLAIEQDRSVLSTTGAYDDPTFIQWSDEVSAGTGGDARSLSINAIPVDLNFLKTFDMKIIAGTDFTRSDFLIQDTTDNYKNYRSSYILNEKAAADLGWTPEEAVGKTISRGAPGTVKAVIRNFNYSSLHNPIGPLVIFLDTTMVRNLFIRIRSEDLPGTLDRLSKIWKERIPGQPFDYHFLNDDFDQLYRREQRSAQLSILFAGIAVTLACLGLFALATYSTQQRTKEIGIRKVMGANPLMIVYLVAREFLALVIISILIATPLSWYAGHRWLQDFAYRITPGIWIFIAAAFVALFIAAVSVGVQAIRAASANPVKSLRYE